MISTCVVPLHLLEVYGAVAVHVIHSEGPRQLVPELIAALIIDKADIPQKIVIPVYCIMF